MQINRYTESLEYTLESTARVVQEALSAKFKELNFGISYDAFIILDEIFHEPGILQIDLAKKILKGRAYTGKFLIVLENKGFIERKTAIKGKKQIVIPNYITPKGQEVLKKGISACKNFVAKVPHLNEDNMETFIIFLKTLK